MVIDIETVEIRKPGKLQLDTIIFLLINFKAVDHPADSLQVDVGALLIVQAAATVVKNVCSIKL